MSNIVIVFLFGIEHTLYHPAALCYKPSSGPTLRDAHLTPSLTSDFANQDAVFALAFSILQEAIEKRAFPCASTAVTHRGRLVALRAFGHFTYEANSTPTQPDTIFDLASISKVLATTTMAILLYQRGLLDIEMPVVGVVPEFSNDESGTTDLRRSEVTLRMLLAHSSGLPAHRPLYERTDSRDELVVLAAKTPLTNDPGMATEYSDIGFIVLGEALTRLADEKLDTFCPREIFGPFGIPRAGFNPLVEQRSLIPPTADEQNFRHRVIQGEVHDDNASVMDGVAGHAGIFAPAEDLALFAHAMLSGGAPILRPENLALFTRRETLPPGTTRTLGLDTPSQTSLAGQYFSAGRRSRDRHCKFDVRRPGGEIRGGGARAVRE